MPMKHAAAKAFRQARKAAIKNRAAKDALKTLRKHALRAAAAKRADEARELFRKFGKLADKAVQKGILKHNTGARLKSRLSLALRKVGA